MSCVVELLRSRLLPLAATLALIIGIAGCSGDSTRFNENPYATTGSIQQTPAAPAARVETQPLPPVAQMAPTNRPATTNPGVAGGGKGMASYNPALQQAPPQHQPRSPAPAEITGSVAAKPAPSWSWDGGTAITVGSGDTLETISRRYGVPASAIMQANNIPTPSALHPGQQLVIPRYSGQSTVASAAAPQTRAPVPTKPAAVATSVPAGNPSVHVVAPGETLSKISRLYGKPLAEIAKANNLQPTTPLKIGDRLVIPGVRVSAKPGQTVAQAKPAPPAAPKEVTSEPTHSISVVTPAPETASAKDSVKAADGTGSLPTFRWPANGRVIAGFGTSPNGVQNDGINIALPEGTAVKAAEEGVVAYAGNELKGYGNLVLVRHPNGYVTAYAHAKELMVKRGDQIKRGQVIARSGQTGNVNAPQLHFEIRKGASPLDPMRFLKGA